MFPEIVELEFPDEELEELKPIGKSFLYDYDKGDFVIVDGRLVTVREKESLKVWIEKTIRTAIDRFRIYQNVPFGVALEDLIGSNFPRDFIESEIKREVTDALVQHTHIDRLEGWAFERDGRWMRIVFNVISPLGAFDMEVKT